jgi:SAM-dependent methyltransferase
MDFYQKFSQYYDDIFPLGEGQYRFLAEQVREGDRVLDIACGTGNYIIELCKNKGVFGLGIDLSRAMLEKAKIKGKGIKNLDFQVKDMLKIDQLDRQFNFIYCIGNSLPHLMDKDLIGKFIEKTYKLLTAEGKFIVQTVNYDNNPKKLKTIINKEKNIKFIRDYEYRREKGGIIVDFCTTLEGDDFKVRGKVPLYPIKSGELIKEIKSIGFKDVEVYGGFNKEEFNPQISSSLVILATK